MVFRQYFLALLLLLSGANISADINMRFIACTQIYYKHVWCVCVCVRRWWCRCRWRWMCCRLYIYCLKCNYSGCSHRLNFDFMLESILLYLKTVCVVGCMRPCWPVVWERYYCGSHPWCSLSCFSIYQTQFWTSYLWKYAVYYNWRNRAEPAHTIIIILVIALQPSPHLFTWLWWCCVRSIARSTILIFTRKIKFVFHHIRIIKTIS